MEPHQFEILQFPRKLSNKTHHAVKTYVASLTCFPSSSRYPGTANNALNRSAYN
uniref:Uncharacterized protein n=1 Tax=Rhizophora mucronata TaxID=61149 RepID=A0A2P2JFB8_RHIMU